MANLRRGLQDHALLTLARQHGLQQQIAAAVERLVPRVFSDAVPTQVGFSETETTTKKPGSTCSVVTSSTFGWPARS